MASQRQEQYVPIEIHNSRQTSNTLLLEPLGMPFPMEPGESITLVVGGPRQKSRVQVFYEENIIQAYVWSMAEIWVYKDGIELFSFPHDLKLKPPAYLELEL